MVMSERIVSGFERSHGGQGYGIRNEPRDAILYFVKIVR